MYLKFEDAYFQYLEYIENRMKIQSKRTLKERFNNNVLPFFKNYNIYEIKEIDYIKWQNEIESKNYSYNFKKNLYYLICGYFDYLIKFYNIKKNIPRELGNFKKTYKKKNTDFYNYKEFKKFIKYVDNEIYKQFFTLMFFTGTRPGEAMALKFSDLNNRTISINKTIDEHHYNGKRNITTPKTFSSIRNIKIDKKLYKNLLELKKYYIKINKEKNVDYFIFGGLKPLAPTTINRYKIKACEKANIRPITLHQFRHSHATLLVNKKIMINEISKRLGHNNTSTTLNIYTHTDFKQEKKVLRTLNFLRLF